MTTSTGILLALDKLSTIRAKIECTTPQKGYAQGPDACYCFGEIEIHEKHCLLMYLGSLWSPGVNIRYPKAASKYWGCKFTLKGDPTDAAIHAGITKMNPKPVGWYQHEHGKRFNSVNSMSPEPSQIHMYQLLTGTTVEGRTVRLLFLGKEAWLENVIPCSSKAVNIHVTKDIKKTHFHHPDYQVLPRVRCTQQQKTTPIFLYPPSTALNFSPIIPRSPMSSSTSGSNLLLSL